MSNQEEAAPSVQALVDSPAEGLLSRRKWLLGAAAAALLVVAWFVLRSNGDTAAPRYKTEAAAVGTLVVKVSATGNLQPTNQVDVGSELSGIVEHVYVDENDRVRKGQVLAELDLSKLKDAVERSRASLAAAQAQALQADATVAEKRAALARLQRVSAQSGGAFISQSDMDTAEANAKRADADLASARAGVSQAQAALKSDVTNLGKASIRSPIDGIVLTRKVEPGQTVAASFQAPVLFTLAEDLAKMELHVDVDEADVGQVQLGQPAVFTVDAWPGRKYDAVITRVGYGSQVKDGVVSYLAVLDVRNDDLSLRPGMTGTAEITTVTREHALLVPNAALRFSPPEPDATPQKKRGSIAGTLMPRPPSTPKRVRSKGGDAQPRVWVLANGVPQPIDVRTGATNGKVTEIVGGELKDGTDVITEAASAAP
ncbi:MAG TPA: efflux RND transporter periplasmic adaptor subunit [Steroidobacteraceae bacterium]